MFGKLYRAIGGVAVIAAIHVIAVIAVLLFGAYSTLITGHTVWLLNEDQGMALVYATMGWCLGTCFLAILAP